MTAPEFVTPRPAWMDYAECAGLDPDLFFPTRDDISSHYEAIRVCNQCPVRLQCLEYALDNNERKGVWGGTTGKQRRQILARRRRGVTW